MNFRNIFLMALAGLILGGLVGFLQPYLISEPGEEQPEPVDLASYVKDHPLQARCVVTGTFSVELHWALPDSVTVNRLLRGENRAAGSPVFQGKVGKEASFSEYIDTRVTAGNSYVYQVQTDNGVTSNRITVSAGTDSCTVE